jgi:hypothetical protein
MTEYRPDKWVVLKLTRGEETSYKVLGGWRGGYLEGDSWRMNSGILGVEEKDHYFWFHGHSGSTYLCHKDAYGFIGVTAALHKWLTENHTIPLTTFELMPEETDWLKLV